MSLDGGAVLTTNLALLLERAARTSAGRTAITYRGEATSYEALASRAGAFAQAAREAGLLPGARAAMLLERGADAAAAIAGIHAAGGIALNLNERLRLRQIEHQLRDAGAELLITTAEMLERFGGPPVGAHRVLDTATVPAAAPLEPLDVGESALAQIIYTSGSTGLPKGVMFSHRAIGVGVVTVAGYLGLHDADRVASLLPFSSVYGLNQLLCTIAVGGTLVVERSPLAADVVATLRREMVTVLAAVPPLWLQLLAVPGFQLPISSLRQVQNAGGHLPLPTAQRLRAAQPQAAPILQYGMTETWRSTFLKPEEFDTHPGSMGRAVPGAEILVLREDGTRCAPQEIGELVHAGPTIAEGYWQQPAATAEVFRPHPLGGAGRAVFSGDLVRADAAGFLQYVGRRDRIIKTLGFRVGPDEIADALHASGEVTEAVVSGEDDPERGQRIVAYVVLEPKGSVERLARYCRQALPPYMQPARIESLAKLPRLASGKFDLASLQARE